MSTVPTIAPYVALDLLSWRESATLELTPKFQRKPIWTLAAKSYLIDSLLRSFPVPPLHIRLALTKSGTPVREVIDGQQRLRTVFDFIQGRFALSDRIDSKWAGLRFDDLPEELRDKVLLYKFFVYQYDSLDDESVLEIFARLNTYSISLNRQELRNGKYFGAFKTTAYESAVDHLADWRSTRLFSESRIARMADAELTSELFVLLMAGEQDKKKSLDEFYRLLDESWGTVPPDAYVRRAGPNVATYLPRDEVALRFRTIMSDISLIGHEALIESRFNTVPLFYSLFDVLAHRRYWLPGWNASSPGVPLNETAAKRFRSALGELGEGLADYKKNPQSAPRKFQAFVLASASQTDNIAPRITRARTIWKFAKAEVQ